MSLSEKKQLVGDINKKSFFTELTMMEKCIARTCRFWDSAFSNNCNRKKVTLGRLAYCQQYRPSLPKRKI